MNDVRDKVILITGASRGIGRATALHCAAGGARLIIHGRDSDALAEVASAIEEKTSAPLVLNYDIGDYTAAQQGFQQIFKHFKRLDGLVNNAGYMPSAVLGMMTESHVHDCLNINLAAAILHMQMASRLMRRQKSGSIVNMSSLIGRVGQAGLVAYAAAKAGLIGATKAAARELAPDGIRVNALAPGFIDTELTRALDPQQQQDVRARIALGNAGSANDIAEAAGFLLGDGSRHITGQVIGIDGGLQL